MEDRSAGFSGSKRNPLAPSSIISPAPPIDDAMLGTPARAATGQHKPTLSSHPGQSHGVPLWGKHGEMLPESDRVRFGI